MNWTDNLHNQKNVNNDMTCIQLIKLLKLLILKISRSVLRRFKLFSINKLGHFYIYVFPIIILFF